MPWTVASSATASRRLNVLRKLLARSLVYCEPRTHLWRLILGDERHVLSRKFNRSGLPCLYLPENQAGGKNYRDRRRDQRFSCRGQNTFLSKKLLMLH